MTMTTNSPNPVDGDVQALIAFLKEKVASLKLAVKQRAFENVRDELVMDLKSAEISLAALTAEPVGNFEYHKDEDGDVTDFIIESDGFSKDSFKLYTTPPAQLLRPVELPPGCTSGYSSPGCEERFIRKSDLISALRQQGYEVKS